ncbi:Unsaturated rhamnogalacturonyl hydrolase YteR [Daldinia childiae]|uniref:Unsaturated rhamnogalacturonyl hydrolase YteR n=1 Tax=Daldinia childiae TaxID=326645 RepID=UPI0014474DC4|nr:Unsaturated rhamnogalacturonyl hydrolase YteR [Daldinia childiae]KAF3064413.1 Unsaturated rhamnogalacturonyl hydrolase YteR [Daldinia childiae]
MRSLFLTFVTGATASASYLAWTADSFIQHGVKKTQGYSEATLYSGYEAAYALTQNETYAEWYRGQIDGAVVLENGTIKDWKSEFYSLDNYRIGNNILWWYERTRLAKYKSAANVIRAQLDRHPRTATGGFWHRQPNYPNQMWLDGIFMADSFYAKWTRLFDAGNETAWDDIARQFDNIDAHTRNRTSNLLVHGYDESKKAVWANPVTGAAPLVWNRAVGWYFMSLLEVIPLFPLHHPGRQRLIRYFTTLAAGLKKAQDEDSGNWWLIMSEPYPGAPGNYIESSASAMFTFGWLKGIRLGLLDESEYLEPALKAYHGLIEKFVKADDDGTLNWEGTVEVGSLGSNGTYEYYISIPLVENDHRGAGPFMLAAYEIERR